MAEATDDLFLVEVAGGSLEPPQQGQLSVHLERILAAQRHLVLWSFVELVQFVGLQVTNRESARFEIFASHEFYYFKNLHCILPQ